MTEKIQDPKGPEHKTEALDLDAEARRNLDRIKEEASQEKDNGPSVEQLRAKAEKHAVSGQEASMSEKEGTPSPFGVQKELKESAYRQTLRHIQRNLQGPDKALSRIIHQPAIEKISNVTAKTVARPSGILGGGFSALLGSSILLYFAKHYGFVYNYTTFFLLFLLGFCVGLVFEGVIKLVRHKKTGS